MLTRLSETRAGFVAGASAFASVAMIATPVKAAEFEYKFGVDTAIDHPITVRMVQCWNAVRRDTGGRLDVKTYPNSALGSDPAMITQTRTGAIQFNANAGAIISGTAPIAAAESVPFAFKNSEQVYKAMDGDFGRYLRRETELKLGVKMFDWAMENGFRQITTAAKAVNKPEDAVGLKLRTPPAHLWVETFAQLGVSTVAMSLGEVYTSLQTHIVDGQENPLTLIEFQRFYEVQKYLNLTSHMWGSYQLMVNADAWKALPSDVQAIVEKHYKTAAFAQRRDNFFLMQSLVDKLRRQGMTIVHSDTEAFRKRLAPLYPKIKEEFGTTAWDLLEKYAGKLG